MESPQIDLGAILRDAGVADALSHYAVETVRVTIVDVSRAKTEFTSEDVVDALPQITRDSLAAFPNALGACFRAAAQSNEIFDTGKMTRALHVKARKRRLVVWAGR